MHSSNVTSIAEYLDDVDRSPTALQLMLAYHLKGLREEAGLSPAEAAKVIETSPSQMSRLENGKRRWQRRGLEAALLIYGVSPADVDLTLRLLEASTRPDWTAGFGSDVLPEWFQQFVGLERAAKELRCFETRAFPGLLQCESYAHAIVEGDAMGQTSLVRRRLKLRAERQKQVFRPNGPTIWVVLEEGVLQRPFGDRHVMRAQLLHLKDVLESNDQKVVAQILPTNLGVSRPSGSFTYLQFALEGLSDKVYTEHPGGATYYDEKKDVNRHHATFDRLSAGA
ncbi:helix-turn-helix domain-containing protein, partial [Streptomyces noursei]